MIKTVRQHVNRCFGGRYGKTLLVFLFAQVLLLDLAIVFEAELVNNLIPGQGIETLQIVSFIVSVFVLVSTNTVIFIMQVNSLLTDMTPLTDRTRWELACRRQKQSQYWLVCSVAVSAIVISQAVGFFYSGLLLAQWETTLHLVEGLSVFLFIIFVFVDYMVLKTCDSLLAGEELNGKDKEKVQDFRKDTQLYLRASDGPGVLGMCFILTISLLFPVADLQYWKGFVVGAMGLHMAFSQSSLAFLSMETK